MIVLERGVIALGVLEYTVSIMDALPKELKGSLPTTAEIEEKLIWYRQEDKLDRNER